MNQDPKHSKTKNSNDKETKDSNNDSVLLPGLPNHLAQLCLSTVNPSLLYSVCRSWRRLIYSPSFPPFFSLYAVVAKKKREKHQHQSDSIGFFTLDPISSTWTSLPNPPPNPPLCLLHRHPSFVSRNFSIQSLAASDHLVLIAATTPNFLPALSHPLVFDPLSNQWFFGPRLPNPRRWCAAGSSHGTVYVAGGFGVRYRAEVARLVEKWDMNKKRRSEWKWEKMEGLKDGRFSREGVEVVGYKGKLCMVNVKASEVKEGVVFDIEKNRWEKMKKGMVSGWNGPVGVEEEEVMYVVDEKKGVVRKYDAENDSWEEMIEGLEILKGAEQIALCRGKVCVVSSNGGRIVVVDVVVKPVRIWVVNPPSETEVIAVHILPRMSFPEN